MFLFSFDALSNNEENLLLKEKWQHNFEDAYLSIFYQYIIGISEVHLTFALALLKWAIFLTYMFGSRYINLYEIKRKY